MINETFPANFIKIRVGEGTFWNFADGKGTTKSGNDLPQLGFWWNLQERFCLSLWSSPPNFKIIALLKQILVFPLNIGNWKFWECCGRVFFSRSVGIFTAECLKIYPWTRSEWSIFFFMTLGDYQTPLTKVVRSCYTHSLAPVTKLIQLTPN